VFATGGSVEKGEEQFSRWHLFFGNASIGIEDSIDLQGNAACLYIENRKVSDDAFGFLFKAQWCVQYDAAEPS